jgi:hypothetical protein
MWTRPRWHGSTRPPTRTGVSRNVLLKELLARYANQQSPGDLTDEQIAAFGESVRDLLDEDRRAGAWRR